MYTVEVVTPSSRTSCATHRSHTSNALFDARYADQRAIGGVRTPAVDTFTMCPDRRSRIDGSSSSTSLAGPR